MSERLVTTAVRVADSYGQRNWTVTTSVGLMLAVCESHYSLLTPCCQAAYEPALGDEWIEWNSCGECRGAKRRHETASVKADECTIERLEDWLSTTELKDPLEITLLAIQLREELWAIVEPWRRGKVYR